MTTPNLSLNTPYGRLYRFPGAEFDDNTDYKKLLVEGKIFPSVTNIIDVANKPYLKVWAAKLAAQAAVQAAIDFPDRMTINPKGASAWAAKEHERVLSDAAQLGDTVHNICEDMANGKPRPQGLNKTVSLYVDSFEKFCADFQPKFLKTESTMFGDAAFDDLTPLKYAGTADFIAEIDGVVLIGDHKTGRNVYDSAAQQLGALSHAEFMVSEDETSLEDAMFIEGGIVLHLGPKGYKVYEADIERGWEVFRAYRAVWGFYAESSASRKPLLLSDFKR